MPIAGASAFMRVFDFSDAIVRLPGRSVVDGLRAHDGAGPTFEGVLSEHQAYVSALEAAGVAVERLPPLEHFPDSVFVEDPALVFSEAAILLKPGAATREAEADELAPALRRRFDRVIALDEGAADGGDVLVTPETVFIGLSDRTNRQGAESLAALLRSIGRQGRIVETPRAILHLKTACSLIDEETVLATDALAATGIFDRYRVLIVPEGEEHGANLLRVNDTILMGAGFPRLRDRLERPDVRIVELGISEIGKIDAGLTCMSLRWYGQYKGVNPRSSSV